MSSREVVVASTPKRFEQLVTIGPHDLVADEPVDGGGADAGPGPYELLLASLGTCTSMTLMLYARHKKWPLERVVVRLTHRRDYDEDCEQPDDPSCRIDRIERRIELTGDQLSDEQRARFKEIADRCPVHKTLTGRLEIETQLVQP
jgi:putative redox protein